MFDVVRVNSAVLSSVYLTEMVSRNSSALLRHYQFILDMRNLFMCVCFAKFSDHLGISGTHRILEDVPITVTQQHLTQFMRKQKGDKKKLFFCSSCCCFDKRSYRIPYRNISFMLKAFVFNWTDLLLPIDSSELYLISEFNWKLRHGAKSTGAASLGSRYFTFFFSESGRLLSTGAAALISTRFWVILHWTHWRFLPLYIRTRCYRWVHLVWYRWGLRSLSVAVRLDSMREQSSSISLHTLSTYYVLDCLM